MISFILVDDNVRQLEHLEELLKRDEEIRIIGKADNGIRALELIKEKKPDFVILDLIMPGLDGLGLLQKVKMSDEITKKPRFWVITAVSTEEITNAAFSYGAEYYMLKPIYEDILLGHIKSIKPSIGLDSSALKSLEKE